MAFLRKITSNVSDAELVQQYQQSGELSVLGDLYNRYMEPVYGVCLKYLKDPENAQDAVMAVFEELITKLQRHQVDNFKSWLYTVSKNHCLMKLRAEKGKTPVKMADEFMQSEENLHLQDVLAKEEHFQQLEYCMGQLNTEQRKVIELFYLQGKCYNEISVQTGLEWKNVRSFIQNGRRNLKICMESQALKTMEK
ncbi:MAG TPA: sigma-70 family RNA polymerase sigma factor [Flavisolibacter sp.]|nr:sigma-70 family RNA polymerase sigma factor [Flavisolibacter sp.]